MTHPLCLLCGFLRPAVADSATLQDFTWIITFVRLTVKDFRLTLVLMVFLAERISVGTSEFVSFCRRGGCVCVCEKLVVCPADGGRVSGRGGEEGGHSSTSFQVANDVAI